MKWKILALLASLAIGTVLPACGPDSPATPDSTVAPVKIGTLGNVKPQDTPISLDIPEKGLSALDRYGGLHSDGEYEVISAVRALRVEGIEQALRAKGIESGRLRNVDEAWCVRISPVVVVFVEHYCGPHATDCPQGPMLSYDDRVLLVRRGDIWGALAVRETLDQVEWIDRDEENQALRLLLDALGCDNLQTE